MSAPGGIVAAALLLAAALLVGGSPAAGARLRALTAAPPHAAAIAPVLRTQWAAVGGIAVGALGWVAAGPAAGLVLGAMVVAGLAVALRRAARSAAPEDAAELAGRWELLALCLEAGLPVAAAVTATAGPLPGAAGARLRRIAGLLELGADPADAWRIAEELPALAAFARAAARSSGTGAALAKVASAEGDRLRASLIDTAHARAQRAGVLITGPLGLCFLPAFLVLGIAPVVIGLAGKALTPW